MYFLLKDVVLEMSIGNEVQTADEGELYPDNPPDDSDKQPDFRLYHISHHFFLSLLLQTYPNIIIIIYRTSPISRIYPNK